MKIFAATLRFLKKLYIPLYIFLFLAFVLGELIVNSFETYALADFKELVTLIQGETAKAKRETPRDGAVGQENRRASSAGTSQETNVEPEHGFTFTLKIGPDEKTAPQATPSEPSSSYSDLINYSYLLIIFWLWPVYRYNFSNGKQYTPKLERRIINLPLIISLFVWAIAAYRLFFKCGCHYYQMGGFSWDRTYAIYLAGFFIFGALVSHINLGITTRYVNNHIAQPIFSLHNLYGFKRGFSISLSMRIVILIFSLAIVPMLLNLYFPLAFNAYRWPGFLQGLTNPSATLDQSDINIFLPIMAMAFMSVIFLFAQISAIFSYRKSTQRPINLLIDHMQKVQAGDLTSKTSVLGNDEIGKLKAHFNEMLDGLLERERIRDTFGKFVSIEIAEKIIKSGQLDFSGEEIEATVMFSDIRNFTPLCATLKPQNLIRLLNDYFSSMIQPIQAENGVINKFIGDAVMALFSPVFGVKDHASAALRAALSSRKALEDFNKNSKYPALRHGLGLHSGKLISGNVGTSERMEYTVIGETVNIAARIEKQSKEFETDLLISQEVLGKIKRDEFPGLDFIPYPPIQLKGTSRPITLYRVVGQLQTNNLAQPSPEQNESH